MQIKVPLRKQVSPLNSSIENIIVSQGKPLRVFDAREKYYWYTRKIIETIFKRSLSESSLSNTARTIPFNFFHYLQLRNILVFKIVSKEFLGLSVGIDKIKPPLVRITKEMISVLPVSFYQGPLKVFSSYNDTKKAICELTNETVLGFDTETQPAFKRGENYLPSLIQLAGENVVCVFQLHSINIALFKILFEDEKIKKVGVGVANDIKQLQKLGSFQPAGFIEISELTSCNEILNKGLKPLAAYALEIQILKTKRVQLSNWADLNLTKAQIEYAATDAWISRKIYIELAD